ncbi:thiamine biosynthesis protein ThiS [Methylovirgula ligni]|uniref:Sulfur carrier protein n=1 Tax=Methylovirgula ligni TaxID=569860 RepID=A0A3D9Z5N1_9HYPH|nr:sulfur carrier protein ThiS [Methylovirgula ligni]QAY95874.1 thiamine biosynthesis protein ThiS [Methylovirgula ligni]REF86479.1 sulfur carrier protein [Methylovirgula ligni]
MQIRVNGKAHEVSATTLAALLAELDYQDKLVATAVNQSFVRAVDRPTTKLNPDDAVEILVPRQGG